MRLVFHSSLCMLGLTNLVQAKKFGDRKACSYRDIVDVVEEKKMVPNPDGKGEVEKVWK